MFKHCQFSLFASSPSAFPETRCWARQKECTRAVNCLSLLVRSGEACAERCHSDGRARMKNDENAVCVPGNQSDARRVWWHVSSNIFSGCCGRDRHRSGKIDRWGMEPGGSGWGSGRVRMDLTANPVNSGHIRTLPEPSGNLLFLCYKAT